MSIRDRQIADAEAAALQRELQAGRYPELTTIQRMIAEVFANTPAGLPQFQLEEAENNKVSDPEAINTMLWQMLTDITTGFSEVVSLENTMMGMADYYETEKNKVNKGIGKLARRVESIEEKMKHRTQANVITKHFHDFIDLEMTGDDTRNLPSTTALVDLKKGVVTLDKIRQGSVRYDLTGVNIDASVSGTPLSTASSGEISNLLKDAVNAAWRYTVTTNTVEPVTVTVKLALKDPVQATTIGFLAESPAATQVTLHVSEDDVTYIKQGTKSLTGMGTWSIPLTAVQYVKFELVKEEPDGTEGTTNTFEFGASRVLIQKESYQSEGKLVSAAIPVGTMVVDQVTVTPIEDRLPGTIIRYYIAIDDGHLEWIEADGDGVVSFGAYKPFSTTISSSTRGYGDPVDEPQFGHQNYALASLDITPAVGATKLYIGEQMWQMDHYTGAVPATPLTTTGPSDWASAVYDTSYVDLKRTFSGNQIPLQPGYTKMTIECQIESDLMPFVQRLQVNPETIVAVYLNNTLLGGVKQDDGWDYTYKLVAGVNKLEVYFYTAVDGYAAPNLDLMLRATWARASSKPLTEVSLANLYNNTSVKDRSRFAWKDNVLVTNYAPAGVRYWLETKYTTKTPEPTSIRFMAILTRSSSAGDSSAALHQYQLVVK